MAGRRAVEILSPYTSSKDYLFKLSLYEKHGVKEYWLVDPGNRYVHVYVLEDNGRYPSDPKIFVDEDVIRCAVLDGLTIEFKYIFE